MSIVWRCEVNALEENSGTAKLIAVPGAVLPVNARVLVLSRAAKAFAVAALLIKVQPTRTDWLVEPAHSI